MFENTYKVTKYLGNFWKIICQQKNSKIPQFAHTANCVHIGRYLGKEKNLPFVDWRSNVTKKMVKTIRTSFEEIGRCLHFVNGCFILIWKMEIAFKSQFGNMIVSDRDSNLNRWSNRSLILVLIVTSSMSLFVL